MSGFHSKIEKDVFHYLLKGVQPMILVLARGMKKRFETEIQKALEDGRILIISPFADTVRHATTDTAIMRNRIMAEIADEIFVAHAEHGGKLEKLIEEITPSGKKIRTFDNTV